MYFRAYDETAPLARGNLFNASHLWLSERLLFNDGDFRSL